MFLEIQWLQLELCTWTSMLTKEDIRNESGRFFGYIVLRESRLTCN